MALRSMDDKLLGEKVEYYCSSSEEEEFESVQNPQSPTVKVPFHSGHGTVHTGPKGVIEDWRHYKRVEHEERRKNAAERQEIIKKLSYSCDTKPNSSSDDDDNDEEFLQWYHKKRMMELQQKFASRWTGITFGKVTELTSKNYAEEIESEKHFVTIVIHIYDNNIPACEAMSGCFKVLARQYRKVKFCQIKGSEAMVSDNFLSNGLPAVLVYKNNVLLGNYIRVSEHLGDDFYATDVESFLTSYGVLPARDDDLDEADPDSRKETDEDD